MTDIKEVLSDPNWKLTIEVDPNDGGDGQHVRLNGDSNTFRAMATLLTVMADAVDDSSHPSSALGWHFALTEELPQLKLQNASLVAFNCDPIGRDDEPS